LRSGGESRGGTGVILISEILPVTGVALGGELPSNITPPLSPAFSVEGTKDAENAIDSVV
jgi:hypothetical protein